MSTQVNALKGYFYQGKPEKKTNQKEYTFKIPEKLLDKFDTREVRYAYVFGKKKDCRSTKHPAPFIISEWLTLSDEELATHRSIKGFKFKPKDG